VVCSSPGVIPVAVLVYAGSDHLQRGSNFGSVTAVGIAAGLAALISGVLVGFLFGLPQTVSQAKPKGLLTTNTSLDQITDWLTKILVGLGLVQLGKLSHGVSKLSSSLAPGLGNGPGAKAFATALLVFGAADGFLIGYLWARLVLSKRFNVAARGLAEEPSPLPAKPSVVAKTTAGVQVRGLAAGRSGDRQPDPDAQEPSPADPPGPDVASQDDPQE
jgi:hypothetical protein